jgi:basic amino acid/polyamine antiporter, APA family
LVPILYIVGATAILVMLFTYRPATTWPGLAIVILGVPIYFLLARSARAGHPPS